MYSLLLKNLSFPLMENYGNSENEENIHSPYYSCKRLKTGNNHRRNNSSSIFKICTNLKNYISIYYTLKSIPKKMLSVTRDFQPSYFFF